MTYYYKFGVPLIMKQGVPCIKEQEERYQHLYCLGATRAGKSSVFLNLINHEIENAMIVLDPAGNLAEAVASLAPAHRLLYVDKNHPIVINPLQRKELNRSERANELIEVINSSVKSLTTDQVAISVKMARIIRNAIAVFEEKHLNLEYLSNFLDSAQVRADHFKQVPITNYWKEFDYKGYKYDQIRMSAERVSDRFSLLYDDETLRPFIIGKNQFNIKEIVNKRQIVVFNLHRFDDAVMSLIGNLVSHALKNYYRRQATTDSPPIFFFADEFHLFITPFFDGLLTGAGKYHISLNFSHHTHSQIDHKLLDIVMECFTKIVLTCGEKEAQRMSREMGVTIDDIMQLKKYEAYVSVGKNIHHIKTFPPPEIKPPIIEYNFLREGYFKC